MRRFRQRIGRGWTGFLLVRPMKLEGGNSNDLRGSSKNFSRRRVSNPWSDQDRPWEEFKWDVRHPREFGKALVAGAKGESEFRMIAFALIGVGVLQVAFAILILTGRLP